MALRISLVTNIRKQQLNCQCIRHWRRCPVYDFDSVIITNLSPSSSQFINSNSVPKIKANTQAENESEMDSDTQGEGEDTAAAAAQADSVDAEAEAETAWSGPILDPVH